ncbi:hypothetical protein PLICRDRAFT_107066, partial [Plicaturopsis crispa FD-325 SS-3]
LCTGALAFYGPKIFQDISKTTEKLHRRHSHLRRNFSNSIYPTMTFNFGPATVCFEHTDSGNGPVYWCAVTPGGSYNPKLGGHLILFDLKLIIEFPPGSTILLPSGSMRHGNVPIQEGETRMSITQYCPGGLTRWVRYGFKTADALGKDRVDKIIGDGHKRWRRALRKFSRVDDLCQDRMNVFA